MNQKQVEIDRIKARVRALEKEIKKENDREEAFRNLILGFIDRKQTMRKEVQEIQDRSGGMRGSREQA